MIYLVDYICGISYGRELHLCFSRLELLFFALGHSDISRIMGAHSHTLMNRLKRQGFLTLEEVFAVFTSSFSINYYLVKLSAGLDRSRRYHYDWLILGRNPGILFLRISPSLLWLLTINEAREKPDPQPPESDVPLRPTNTPAPRDTH